MSQNHILLETIQLTQSGVSSVVLDNIPQTGYTDLKVVVSARTTRTGTDKSDELRLKFNNITSGYSTLMIEGNGSTTRTVADASGSYFGRGSSPADDATASIFGNTEYYIPNYAGSTNKTISIDTTSENNGGEAMALVVSGLLTNTAAVTSLTFTAVGTYDAGSTFSIYGIAELGTTPVTAPFASGGNRISQDGTYWYHEFLTSGTFTPAKNLTCDYLVLAGGGGGMGISSGGAYGAPGGGAGGYRTSVGTSGRNSSAESPLSLAVATNYAVTVGAGGAANTLGSDSILSTITSLGGGTISGGTTVNGGSGSGAFDFSPQNVPGAGTANQGFGGGTSPSATSPGGGGGAGGAGSTARQGGVGITSSISGSSVGRGGGGGGGYTSVSNATDGGGSGGIANSNNGSAGTANTGGGGGGGSAQGTTTAGGAGGSGIVIIRYPMSS
jgi:hypothetical protein